MRAFIQSFIHSYIQLGPDAGESELMSAQLMARCLPLWQYAACSPPDASRGVEGRRGFKGAREERWTARACAGASPLLARLIIAVRDS